jgi:proteasome accessory factor A
MINRIFGLETEYGLLINQDRPEHSPSWVAHQIRDHLFHHQQCGVLDLHHRGHDEPPGNGGFLTNAGRMYLDMGHLEYASPECGTLTDLVASDRAGDQLLQQALDEMGLSEQVSLIKNNIDHQTDATFGSHENYLVTRRFPFSRRGLGLLVPFLVTRQIFTGSGRVGAADTPDGWVPIEQLIIRRPGLRNAGDRPALPFQISQRADHIVNDFFEWVQQNRAIVNTRDEPLADPNQFRRIHLLLGDSNMSEVATALKLGTTGLVLQLIEEGRCPSGFDLEDAVETLKEVSRDQEQDEETDWVLDQWESVLTDLREGYRKVVGRVDWASKLWLLESFREAEKMEWNDPWMKSLDLEYHNLHPEKGLFFGLIEEGRAPRVTTDKAIELARRHPPRNTRAFGRGELIRHLMDHGAPMAEAETQEGSNRRFFPDYVINWSIFQVRGRPPFPMPDPFKTYAQEVRQHLASS